MSQRDVNALRINFPVVKYVTETKMKKSAVTEHQRLNLTQAVTQKISNKYIEDEQHFIKPYVVDSYNNNNNNNNTVRLTCKASQGSDSDASGRRVVT